MSDKNFMKHMGITDKDVVEMLDAPDRLVGNADIDFYASYSIYLQNLEHNDPNSEAMFEGQLEKLMVVVSPRLFMDCSFRFEDGSSSFSVVEMRDACKSIYKMYQ